MLTTGNEELGFDFGEVAWETATTSKEGSRRVNYSLPKRRGSDDKYQCPTSLRRRGNWNGHNVKRCASNDWRDIS